MVNRLPPLVSEDVPTGPRVTGVSDAPMSERVGSHVRALTPATSRDDQDLEEIAVHLGRRGFAQIETACDISCADR